MAVLKKSNKSKSAPNFVENPHTRSNPPKSGPQIKLNSECDMFSHQSSSFFIGYLHITCLRIN